MEKHRKTIKAVCPGCGAIRVLRPSMSNRLCRSCSVSKSNGCQTMDKNRNWKGGTAKHTKGYIRIRKSGHPRSGTQGYVFEHILVMEESLGRHLKPGETVHHKNGIRTDNRLKNLELWTTGHPSGSRVEDLVNWVIAEYPEEIKNKFHVEKEKT